MICKFPFSKSQVHLYGLPCESFPANLEQLENKNRNRDHMTCPHVNSEKKTRGKVHKLQNKENCERCTHELALCPLGSRNNGDWERLKDQDFINLLLVFIVSKFTDKEFSVLILEGENISSMQSQIKQVIHQTAKVLCPHPLPFKQCFLPFPIYFAFAEWVLYSAVEFYSSPRKREQWSSRHRCPGWPYRCTSMSCVWQRSL